MLLSWLRMRLGRSRKICFDIEACSRVESVTMLIGASEVKIIVIQPSIGARPIHEILKKAVPG